MKEKKKLKQKNDSWCGSSRYLEPEKFATQYNEMKKTTMVNTISI